MGNNINRVAFLTIARKEIQRILRIWVQTIIPPIITGVLYFVIFGNLIGSQLNKIHGVTYMEFIVPGMIMLAVITNSYTNVVSSFYSAKFGRSIEEILVSPTSGIVVILGYTVGGMVRGLVVGAVVWLIASFFTSVSVYSAWNLVLFATLTSLFFSLAGFANAMFAKKFDDAMIVPEFVLRPLIYFGGIFYSIEMLPPSFQTISKMNPILYMVNGLRYGFTGISEVNLSFSLFMLLMMSAVMFCLDLYLLRKRVGIIA
jgi:ABC-2 type transport system permease protein